MRTWKRAKETVAWAEAEIKKAEQQRKQEKAAAAEAERIANGGRR